VLNLDLERSEITAGELQRADELVREKYDHPAWNERI
jgi:hypothetical protein